MKFDLGNLVKMANTFSNPKQAINMLLAKMEKTNPSKAKMLKTMYNSGKSPATAIRESAKNGEINIEQLEQLKNFYYMGKKLGLKINVPKSVWVEAENAIKNAKPKNNSINGF